MANILELFQTEYNNNITPRYQQRKSRLDGFVEWDEINAERKDYPRSGAATNSIAAGIPDNYNGVTNNAANRFQATPIVQPDFDKRWAYGAIKYKFAHFNQWDEKMLGNIALPNSTVQREALATFARDCDDVIWTAALGNAKSGQLGTTDVALPAGQKIVAGGTGMTLAKLMATLDILDDADNLDEEGEMQRVFLWTVRERSALLNTTEVKSSDYNTVKALAEGKIDTFMGFKFKIIKRLPNSAGVRSCVAFQKGAIKAYKHRIETQFGIRGDIFNALQISDSWRLGAVRVQDEGVVQVDVTSV